MPRKTDGDKPQASQPSWEERVIALETQNGEKDAKISAQVETIGAQQEALSGQTTRLTEQSEQIAALQGTVDALQAAETARKTAASEAYTNKIAGQAAKAGKPIPEDKLKMVSDAFERGDDETAKQLGDAFLQLSLATGGGKVGGGDPQQVALGVTDDVAKATEESLERFRARHLRRSPTLQSQAREASA